MKKIVLFFLLALPLLSAQIDDYAFGMDFERDFKTAISKAKKEHKPLMMVLGSDYCPWCRKFERETLNSELIEPYLSNDVVTLIVDKRHDAQTFPKKFQTRITPRVFFINPQSVESFYDTMGFVKKKEFAKELEVVKRLYKAQ